MSVIRKLTHQIDEAAYKFVQGSILEREIPKMCILYVTDLNDTHDDIINDASYVRYGDEFLLNGVTSTGLYAGRSELERIGKDANVATWQQTFKVSTVQPNDLGKTQAPLSRGVIPVARVNGFRKITSLMDWNNSPVVNRAGDYLSGFQMEVPTPTYRFKANFATIPAWARNLDGCVNSVQKVLPLRQRFPDGTLVTLDNITLNAGTARLRVTNFPLSPDVEGGVPYFPIEWEYQVSPIGWSQHLLNRGRHELVYLQPNGDLSTLSEIQAKSYSKVIRRAVLDDEGETVKDPVWLDRFGRKLPVAVQDNQVAGTIECNENFRNIAGVSFTFTEEWLGRLISVQKPGSPYRWVTEIVNVNEGTANTADPAPFTSAETDIYYSGINAVTYLPVPYADLSSVPV